MVRKFLLGCGVAAAVWWVAMDVVGSLRYPGYSYRDWTISELSAQGSPVRTFMTLASGIPYTALLIAFGVGIWKAAGGSRAGRATGAVVVAEAVWGCVGGLAFPMATRAAMAASQDTPRNQMHLWYGIGMPVLFMLAIGFGSRLLGRGFRYYSYATILAMLVFGLVQGLRAGALAANAPTPWMGVEERVCAYAPMLWFVVLAIALLRVTVEQPEGHRGTPTTVPTARPLTPSVRGGTH
jgi:hypothetical protein